MSTEGLWSWGVDVGERKLAIGAIQGDRRTWAIADPGKRTCRADLGKDLHFLRQRAYYLARDFARDFPPDRIGIELPAGGFRNVRFEAAHGVIWEAIWSAFHEHYAGPPPMLQVTSGKWKKAVLAHGNANAEMYLDYARNVFGRQIGDNYDVAAALCIAAYMSELELR